MRKLMLFLALALAVVLFVAPAFAEVQNVKVGGDVGVRTIAKRSFDLNTGDSNNNNPAARGNPNVVGTDDRDYAIMATVGVNVNADLTDNVGVGVRLINQRDWARYTTSTGDNAGQIDVDLASVTLKEFFYQPLTLVVGRQDLWFGKGFVVGSTMFAHPELNAVGGIVSNSQTDPDDMITSDEFGERTSFDTVRTTFDLNPWTVDAIYSIINNQPGTNDTYLYGANAGYKFDVYNAEAEGYYFAKNDRNIIPSAVNDVNTLGFRGSLEPIANMNLWFEGAYQFGKYTANVPVTGFRAAYTENRRRSAQAADIGADYTWKDISWMPKLGFEAIYYSGEEGGNSGNWNAWDVMYRGKFDTTIREFQGGAGFHYGSIAAAANLYDTDDADDQPSFTNQLQLAGSGSVKLMDAMNLGLKSTFFRAPMAYEGGRDKDLGWELDSNLTYDYTEDVQFGLITAWFFPGKYFGGGQFIQQGGVPGGPTAIQGPTNSTASEVMTTMKVNF